MDLLYLRRRGQKRRDKPAAERFFRRVLRSSPVPRKIVIDQLCSYPAANAEIPELASVKHVFVKAAARVNNPAENSRQPTRERERRVRGFRDPNRTQKFLACFGLIRQHFVLKRRCCALHFIANSSPLDVIAWRRLRRRRSGVLCLPPRVNCPEPGAASTP